jgi:hypothetical protein
VILNRRGGPPPPPCAAAANLESVAANESVDMTTWNNQLKQLVDSIHRCVLRTTQHVMGPSTTSNSAGRRTAIAE